MSGAKEVFERLKSGATMADFFVQQLLWIVRGKNPGDDPLPAFGAQRVDTAQERFRGAVFEASRAIQLAAEVQDRIFDL